MLTYLVIFGFFLVFSGFTFHPDTNSNYIWGKIAHEFGTLGYYYWMNFFTFGHPDQPPLYILFYKFVYQLYQLFYQIFWYLNVHFPVFPSKFMYWFESNGMFYVQKLPFIILLVFLPYFLVRKKLITTKQSLLLIFFPPFIYNTIFWGGNDLLVNILGFASVLLAYHKKIFLSLIVFTACFLFKSSLLLWLPVILVLAVHQKNYRQLILGVLCSVLIGYLLVIPFDNSIRLLWLVDKYLNQFLPGSMPHLTANAFNIYALFFGLKPQPDGIYRTISMVAAVALLLPIWLGLLKKPNLENTLLSLVVTTLISFSFITRMHERYTFPVFLPLLYLVKLHHQKYLKPLVFLTVFHLLNVYHAWWIPRLVPIINLFQFPFLVPLLCIGIIIITGYLYYLQLKQSLFRGKIHS